MEEANRIGFEALPGRLVALDVRKPGDAMVADGDAVTNVSGAGSSLQTVEKVVEWRRRVSAKRDDDRLLVAR